MERVKERDEYIVKTFLSGTGFDTAKGKPMSIPLKSEASPAARSLSKTEASDGLMNKFAKLRLGARTSQSLEISAAAEPAMLQSSATRQRATAMVEGALNNARNETLYDDTLQYVMETRWNDSDGEAGGSTGDGEEDEGETL